MGRSIGSYAAHFTQVRATAAVDDAARSALAGVSTDLDTAMARLVASYQALPEHIETALAGGSRTISWAGWSAWADEFTKAASTVDELITTGAITLAGRVRKGADSIWDALVTHLELAATDTYTLDPAKRLTLYSSSASASTSSATPSPKATPPTTPRQIDERGVH